jgi:hypothetical protein
MNDNLWVGWGDNEVQHILSSTGPAYHTLLFPRDWLMYMAAAPGKETTLMSLSKTTLTLPQELLDDARALYPLAGVSAIVRQALKEMVARRKAEATDRREVEAA